MKKNKVHLVPLGCPKAMVDAEEILAGFVNCGFQNTCHATEADIIIINTCSFINDAKKEALQTIFEYEKAFPAKIVVAGCLAQRYPELVSKLPEVHGWLPKSKQTDIQNLIHQLGFRQTNNLEQTDLLSRIPVERNFAAYVKISEGCNRRCTFCSIPSFKGALASKSIEQIMTETESLIKTGVKEINLVSQDTCSYGQDIYGLNNNGEHLKALIKELLSIKDLYRLRLMYLYPSILPTSFYEFMAAQNKICRYIDMPMQHCNSDILQKMGRRGNRQVYYQEIQKLRQIFPHSAIRSAFISGFPDETEEQHQELLSFIAACQFDWLGVFGYSREENTVAANYTNMVHHRRIARRKRELLDKYRDVRPSYEHLPREQTVLLEEYLGNNQYLGRNEFQAPEVDGCVFVKNCSAQLGDMVRVTICGESNEFDLEAEFSGMAT